MSSEERITFNKDNLETYLKALAKEYRKLGGKALPAEIILIGGASVLINYGFRDMTTDIDAIVQAASTMKEAVNHVGDEYGLPNGWLNDDFKKTASYTPRLAQYSVYYKKYYGVLTVRTVSAEYLIAMKLMAGRQYKNDLSDIIGILAEHEKAGETITIEMVHTAVERLYDSWNRIPVQSQQFIEDVMSNKNYDDMMTRVKNEEKSTKDTLIEFEEQYPGRANEANIDDIIKHLKERKK